MTPNAVLFTGTKPPGAIVKQGLHVLFSDADKVSDLDAATAHWVYLVPAQLLATPAWSAIRVHLAQANRLFVVYGTDCPSTLIVQAMRDGAFDFVDMSEPASRWADATEKAAASQKLWLELYGNHRSKNGSLLVGKSDAIEAIARTIRQVGPTSANVLVIGESGTGKEKVAQSLHDASGLDGPFLPVNCAAIPRDLIESELFGAEKGAFTGALQARQGLVEQATGGTLFLDEIGELDIALQPKLLRFLESRRARRVGGRTEYRVEARILAATNRDLESRIEQNEFRADLFYRLSEIVIKIPPLRAHSEDVPMLAMHFLDEANEKFGKNFVSIDPLLIAAMMKYAWPGNARELRAAIHRLVVLHHGPILRAEWWEVPVAAAPAAKREPASQIAASYPSQGLNRRQMWLRARELLTESGNDQTWTCAQLGIHPTTLFRWIKAGKV
jgi:DNA-binding NtrC family response regulator